ncbi:asparagine synthase-related protein [Brucella pituitosa]|uniref:asparagine synthase-related protein n=1 Tax=Brucella pituitosa TaxID=571256 RepID=UPI0009A25876|nr:asparagine synthase-related protein [Brucella pituitosa]
MRYLGRFETLLPIYGAQATVPDTIPNARNGFKSVIDLKELRGHRGAFAFKVSNDRIAIERPLSTAHDLFCRFHENSWWFSDQLTSLTVLDDRISPCPDFIAMYLVSSEEATDLTPFCDIYSILPGTITTLSSDGSRKSQLIASESCVFPDDQIPNTLTDYLKTHCGSNGRYIIELSGGLDSSSILLSALQQTSPDRISCYTYVDAHVQRSLDLEAAESLCSRYSILHRRIAIQSNVSIISAARAYCGAPSRPSPLLLFLPLHNALLEDTALLGRESAILNGHGGDHIFLAHPTLGAIVDHVGWRPSQMKKAVAIAGTFAKLTGMSWTDVLGGCLQEILARMRSRLGRNSSIGALDAKYKILSRSCILAGLADRCRIHEVLRPERGSIPQMRRRRILMNAIHHGSLDRLTDSRYPTFYPFLNSQLLNWAMNRFESTTFDTRYRRLNQRQSFYARYKDEIFWRDGKGHFDGLVQRLIRTDITDITPLVLNGVAAGLGYINPLAVESELNCCRLGGTPPTPSTILLITLEIYYSIWKRLEKNGGT